MGHKKRQFTSHRKPDQPPPSATPATAAKSGSPSPAEVKAECERALNTLRRGNHHKALRLMKDASTKFEKSAIFHRVAGTISAKAGAIIDDPNVKQRHLKNAVESAKKAKNLSPNSVEYAHFYANLLFDVSNEAKEYEVVISECERALALENPNDPAFELSADETVSFTAEAKEARISQVKSELRGLIQKANIASISSWMTNLSGEVDGGEKYRLIPIRQRIVEDPVEARYLSGNVRRPNEIRKATKTIEERRMEIEVQVTAYKFMQQKNDHVAEETRDSPGSNNSGVPATGSAGSAPKVGERRRYGGPRGNASVSERLNQTVSILMQVKSFWNSKSSEMKRGLVSIRVADLRAHFDGLSSKDGGQAGKVLSEALEFCEINKSWKFWACCRCGETFADANVHIQHVVQQHLGNLSPKLQSVLPQSVDSEWEEMLIDCSWEPLDLTASVRMLEEQSKPEVSDFSGCETPKEQIDDGDSVYSEETRKSFEEKRVEDKCNATVREDGGDDGDSNVHSKTCDTKVVCKTYNQKNIWPLSDDTECAKLLKKISSLFQVLLKEKCLTMTHLQTVIHYTREELQGLFPGSQILSCEVDQMPLCICFLGTSPLKKIVDFLQDLSYSCAFGRIPEEVHVDVTSHCLQVLNCKDRITLDESASSLQLDESLLHFNGVKDDVGSVSSIDDFGKGGQSDFDPLLSWIYSGSHSAEQLATWSGIRKEKSQEGIQLLDMLGKEFVQLQNLCEKKLGLLGFEDVLQGLTELCLEEYKKREQVSEVSYRSYVSILQKRRDEIIEGDNEALYERNRLEMDAISNILKEVEGIHPSQYGYEDSHGGVASHLRDLEAGEEDWRSKDHLQQLDSCTESILQKQKELINVDISKLDAQMMRKLVNMNQLELKLEPVSVLDYRLIILPLVKSFMRAHLEDLAEKDATEKSDAVREAFLAELALDSRSGNDTGKTTQEKVKDRKRNKDLRRIKDSKLGGLNDESEAADQSSFATISDGNIVNSGILESESNDNIGNLEDALRRKIELEVEERRLEETLEYQGRQENEAKQRLLAEVQRQNAVVDIDDSLDESGDVDVGISGDSRCKQVALSRMNDSADNPNSSQRNSKDDTPLIADDSSVGSANSYLIPGDDVLPFEQQVGRRSKQRNSMKVSYGMVRVDSKKFQLLPYGTENVESKKFQLLPYGMESVYGMEDVESKKFQLLPYGTENVESKKFQLLPYGMESVYGMENVESKKFQLVPYGTENVESSKFQLVPYGTENVESSKFQLENVESSKFQLVPYGTENVESKKFQLVPYGKENVESKNSTNDVIVQKDLAWNPNSALNENVGDGGSKTLRQLQAEEDEEERFQADLKKAVMQSLAEGVRCDDVNEMELIGPGLQNEVGEYNCFLNVIIQSLWHLRRFREEFLRSASQHAHVGDPCVVCALFDILTALSIASGDANREPVAPSMLRIALSKLYPKSNFFQEGQMNDASEVLGVIFECLHQSFTSGPGGSDSDSVESKGRGPWDCSSPSCIVHRLFGMDIFEGMNCCNCGLESRHLKYTSFFHNVHASSLRTNKVMCVENSFDELLNFVQMNQQLACDLEVGGCGRLNNINHILSNPPHVFTAVLGWQNTSESVDNIKATLETLSTEIDISVLYRGLDPQNPHHLVSVVCYYGQHYHCFAYSHDLEKWIMYDDKTVKVIGTWEDILSMCERGHLQPQLLFYEAVN
ncbi:hypothetical protein RND81_13G122700 [Saponaria officinalis]|uniref:USP domain-containing protein n=2 Tax=Saponaria officinalis TaxID=3572 RepID=A0AAW1H2I1_SAPOF